MLEMKPACEHCGKQLRIDSADVFICSYECTYCATCTHEILQNQCPNCKGNLEKRPMRKIKEN
ncbi:MAG: DUF1272 domain-containing protein [Arcicella sp.]|nr:DUF1272 domain-containing protein [Arcicella sp.]